MKIYTFFIMAPNDMEEDKDFFYPTKKEAKAAHKKAIENIENTVNVGDIMPIEFEKLDKKTLCKLLYIWANA